MGNVIMKAQQITYGASNVEKALDDLNVPELIELNKRMDAIDAWKANVHEETYTGSELTIENALALPARSLITSINAIQDLHGYDHPWVGGANVQLVDFSAYSTLVDNVSLSYIDGDLTLRSTGTTPNYPLVQYDIKSLKGKTLYFACDFSSSTEGLGHIQAVYSIGGQSTYIEIGKNPNPQTGYSIPNNVEWVYLRLFLRNGTSVGADYWVKYGKIMCASSANPTYSPYSNICPISGRTAAVITRSDGDEISEDFTIQLGTTVYGADINWDTGVLTVTHKGIDMGDLTWNYDAGTTRFYSGAISDIDAPSGGVVADVITEQFKATYANGQSAREDGTIAISVSGAAWVYNTGSGTDKNAFASLVDGHMMVYKLATPTTIQLTPTMLEMLKGYNRITLADGYGEIELKALVLGGDN